MALAIMTGDLVGVDLAMRSGWTLLVVLVSHLPLRSQDPSSS
jgi:hypothetical protein